MKKLLGDSFDGLISSITKFGAFVLLREFNIDGLIRLDDLGKEKFEFAKKSIEEYLSLIEKISKEDIYYSCNYFKRAIQIWKKIGSLSEIQKRITIILIKYIIFIRSTPFD